ncbi:ABC transporter permease [bacterium]|nr:ABC transporter permease [bacterium]
MKAGIIAWTTYLEVVRRPLFWSVVCVAIVAIYPLSFYLPYNTFGEDTKMVSNLGLADIMVAGLVIALFAASVSIAEEIEGKTAITLLSKPISRLDFILGKFLGIMMGVGLLFILVGIAFMITLFFKAGYDAREVAKDIPTAQERIAMIWRVVPGLFLMYFQVMVLCALSVAFSTRLPIHLNITACIIIMLLGHLSNQLVQAAQTDNRFRGVEFVAQVFATILPGFEYFNIGPAISSDAVVPATYVLWAFFYCLLYTGVAIFAALLMFEDRDLA